MWSAVSHEGTWRWRVLMAAAGVVSIAASVVGAAQSKPAPPYVPNLIVHRDIEYVPGGTLKHDAADSPESKLVGGPIQEKRDKVQRANPIAYVTKDDPPFLIVHGDKDPLVPHNQSEILLDALQKAGVEAALYTVPGGGHGAFKDPQVETIVAEFFHKHLRR